MASSTGSPMSSSSSSPIGFYSPPRSPSHSPFTGLFPSLPNKRKDGFEHWYSNLLQEADFVSPDPTFNCVSIESGAIDIFEKLKYLFNNAFKDPSFGKLVKLDSLQISKITEAKIISSESLLSMSHPSAESTNPSRLIDPLFAPSFTVFNKAEKPGSPADHLIDNRLQNPPHASARIQKIIYHWLENFHWDDSASIPVLHTMSFPWHEGRGLFPTKEALDTHGVKVLEIYRSILERYCALPGTFREITLNQGQEDEAQTLYLDITNQRGDVIPVASVNFYINEIVLPSGSYYRSSWGLSTLFMKALIQSHGDDEGMRMPPRIASYHIVIIPKGVESSERDQFISTIEKIFREKTIFDGENIRLFVDRRPDISIADKNLACLRYGIPVWMEVSKFDSDAKKVTVIRRDQNLKKRIRFELPKLEPYVLNALVEIQSDYTKRSEPTDGPRSYL